MWTQGLFYSFYATLWAWSHAGIVIFKISFLISWVMGCQNDKRILHLPFCNSTNDLGTQSYCEIGTFPCHNLLQFMYNSCNSYSTLHSFNLIWNCEMWTQEQDTIAKEKCGLVIYFAKKIMQGWHCLLSAFFISARSLVFMKEFILWQCSFYYRSQCSLATTTPCQVSQKWIFPLQNKKVTCTGINERNWGFCQSLIFL